MADLLASNVTILNSWTDGTPTGKRNKVRQVKWTSTTAGGASNRLLASALGFTKIIRASNILLDSSTKHCIPTVPSADGTVLYACSLSTDNLESTIGDVATSTDYAYCTIEGV